MTVHQTLATQLALYLTYTLHLAGDEPTMFHSVLTGNQKALLIA